jgi:uncharacterized membrane protein
MNDYIIQFIIVVLAMILVDVCWTFYFIKVEERRSIAAGVWSSMIMLAGAVVTTHYVEDRSLMVAAIIGAFIGTAGTVEYKRKKENKNDK